MTIKKIIVAGAVLSGKQTLLHLLDGHPLVGVNLIHDHLLSPFLRMSLKSKKNYVEELNKKDEFHSTDKLLEFKSTKKKIKISLYSFLGELKNSNLISIERYAFLKIIPNYYSVKKKHFHSFDFDFIKYQSEWKNKVFKNKEVTTLCAEELFDAILKSFFIAWNDFDKSNIESKQFVFKSPNHSDYAEFIIKENFNGKIIYVSRDIIGLIKSRAINESIRHQDLGKSIDKIFSYMSHSSFIDKMKNELEVIKKLQKEYPNKVFITSLENLVYHTKEEMQKILKFLNLEENQICFEPSYNGKKITSDHIKKINDDDTIVDKKLINFAQLRFHGYKFFKENYKNIYLSNYINLSLYYIKKLLKNLLRPKSKKNFIKYNYDNK